MDWDLGERVIVDVVHCFENIRVVHERLVIVVPEYEWTGGKTLSLTEWYQNAGEVALSGELSRYILFQ